MQTGSRQLGGTGASESSPDLFGALSDYVSSDAEADAARAHDRAKRAAERHC